MEVEIPGPAGQLAGELEEPAGGPALACGIVCHPHPRHGGSLRNTIVVRAARALRSEGLVTLRFNFRGVEGSAGAYDGTQEVEDANAALGYLARAHPDLSLWVVGYSFGARIAVELALREDAVERVILIAFPCALHSPRALAGLAQPGLLLFGGVDPFGTRAGLVHAVPELPARLEVREIPGADHFFRGRTPLVEEHVREYARSALRR